MNKLSIFLLFLFSMEKLFSQSVRAGEITYFHVSGFTYQFHLAIFSNDSSLQAVTVAWGDGVHDTLQNIGAPVVNPICYNEYSGAHTFPGIGTYVVSTSINFLMIDVANIQFAGLQPFYLEDSLKILDPAFYGYNSSVFLLNPPVDSATTQNIFIHNLNADDPDGDSLSFSLVPFFATGYTFPQATDSLTVNASSGELVWSKPTAAGDYAVAILITEWRSGVVIGTELIALMITVFDSPLGNVGVATDKNPIYITPNPASSYVNIIYSVEQTATLTFTNTYGSVVKQLTLFHYSSTESFRKNRMVSVDDLPSGMYLVTLQDGDKMVSKKMLVTR
ncbi:MAG TPA: T9SS type A sorting domain-containing protein [Chitinophagales bacterium]|nr:T9SS type A sorting domain-containing protein [Chitinophagales bacterium]